MIDASLIRGDDDILSTMYYTVRIILPLTTSHCMQKKARLGWTEIKERRGLMNELKNARRFERLLRSELDSAGQYGWLDEGEAGQKLVVVGGKSTPWSAKRQLIWTTVANMRV